MAALVSSMFRCCSLTSQKFTGRLQTKRYVRALRRSPVRVLYPGGDQAEGKLKPQSKQQRTTRTDKSHEKSESSSLKPEVKSKNRHEAQEESQSLDVKFEKAMPGDKRLSKVVTIAKSKKFRDRHGQILLEGRRLLMDALEAGAVLQTLFFSRVDNLKELPLSNLKHTNLVKVKFEDIKIWSDLVTPQGLLGIFRRPDYAKMNFPAVQIQNSLSLSLICDNIRDPGNLGTILRCAAGAGCNKVLLTKGCVDAWEPKVLRAGMGAHFRLPVITSLDWDIVPNYLSPGTRVFVADNIHPENSNKESRMSGKAGDYGWISTQPKKASLQEDHDFSSDDESSEEDSDKEGLYIPDVQIQSYHQNWAREPSALVIGGETHGLSLESLLLAEKSGGKRLFIPVVPGVDSLNSAMAASILLFEGKRQLQEKTQQKV
ncbi:rRNA methyltransferase 3, mitochondrial [Bombina bombina]|uniref:rRNA methyltransferase 3, mitochondrial n=1 Tax=Bombina bombina TaxID=8345 RepID=UPI00235A8145|nr:rRNA methyltransferase 3, mitochondrial [Bombina bombina]